MIKMRMKISGAVKLIKFLIQKSKTVNIHIIVKSIILEDRTFNLTQTIYCSFRNSKRLKNKNRYRLRKKKKKNIK